MPKPANVVTLTEEELTRLTELSQAAAKIICETWDFLSEIEERIKLEWAPHNLAVSDIFRELAADCHGPETTANITREAVAEYFTNAGSWCEIPQPTEPRK